MGRHTKNLAEAIRAKLASDPDLAQQVDDERFSLTVADEVYRARTDANLTQKQLAERMGTKQSVIARLEDADYDGHSLKLLKRLAEATGSRLEVRFVSPAKMLCELQTIEIPEETVSWAEYPSKWSNDFVNDSGRDVQSMALAE